MTIPKEIKYFFTSLLSFILIVSCQSSNTPLKSKTASEILGNPSYLAISYGGYRHNDRTNAPTVEEIKEDIQILHAAGFRILRTYHARLHNHTSNLLQAISELKEEDSDFEMYVMIGVWIQCENAWTDAANHSRGDTANNKAEIDQAITMANTYPDIVKVIAVNPGFINKAEIKGEISYPGQYEIRKGDRLFDLLREEGLLIKKKRRYTKTTDSKHWMRRYPNLIKDMTIERPEQVWVADITYVPVGTGFNYLHLVTDAYSKKVMGYHISSSLAATESRIALDMAIKSRKYKESLIHHSDRGLQYSSIIYKEGADANNITISMTENGDPYENAIAERINGILKDEFGLDEIITNADEAKKIVAQSIDIYNNQGPQLSNSYKTPNEMHQQRDLAPIKWHKKGRSTLQSAPPLVTSTIT